MEGKKENKNKGVFKQAFTLAEILICTAILGVVAALAIAVVAERIEAAVSRASIKKVYSELTRAIGILNYDSGGQWYGLCNNFDDKCFRDLFATRLGAMKICNKPMAEGCTAQSKFKNNNTFGINIDVNYDWPALVTKSGYSVKFRFHHKDCKNLEHCGWIQVDTNGPKRPNVVGRDIFFFTFFPDRTVRPTHYNESKSFIINDCKNGNGVGCGVLYLMNEL